MYTGLRLLLSSFSKAFVNPGYTWVLGIHVPHFQNYLDNNVFIKL